MEELEFRQIRFQDVEREDEDGSEEGLARSSRPQVLVWGVDQHLPLGCINVHDDDESRRVTAREGEGEQRQLILADPAVWEGEDPGETLRCGLIWHGVRPFCTHLTQILGGDSASFRPVRLPSVIAWEEVRVVELGAGMGVVGMLAAQLTGAPVLLTDGHAAVVHLLRRNIALNARACTNVTAERLRWGTDDVARLKRRDGRFDMVLAGDVVYYQEQVAPFLATARSLLARTAVAVMLMAHADRFEAMQEHDAVLAELLRAAEADYGFEVERIPFVPRSAAEEGVHLIAFRHTGTEADGGGGRGGGEDLGDLRAEPFLGLD